MTQSARARPAPDSWAPRHLAALFLANVALALGPWLVRLADTGPVASGFWRLALALPLLSALALRELRGGGGAGPVMGFRTGPGMGIGMLALIVGGGLFFALDLASWHIGIEKTKLANASLFGNAGSLILMVWGLLAARRRPRLPEMLAVLAALAGAGLLMGGSLEISHANLVGDLYCLLAGFFYAFYILMLNSARARLGPFAVLAISTAAGLPVALAIAMLRGEAVLPHDWLPLVALAMGSQVIGQGLLIYALGHFRPLVIGLALLTQPAISAISGWLAFGEAISAGDAVGMVLLAAALVMARAGDRK